MQIKISTQLSFLPSVKQILRPTFLLFSAVPHASSVQPSHSHHPASSPSFSLCADNNTNTIHGWTTASRHTHILPLLFGRTYVKFQHKQRSQVPSSCIGCSGFYSINITVVVVVVIVISATTDGRVADKILCWMVVVQ